MVKRFATQCSKTSASSDLTSDTVECGLADAPNICRPWLFQAAPGSYQFAIAIEDVAQRSLFGPEVPSIEEIKGTFVALLRDAAEDPQTALAERVPDKEYRGTFLKLARALAPTGKDFSVLTVRRSSTDPEPITLDATSRKVMGDVIRKEFTQPPVTSQEHADQVVDASLHCGSFLGGRPPQDGTGGRTDIGGPRTYDSRPEWRESSAMLGEGT